jgi:hypothetical protein
VIAEATISAPHTGLLMPTIATKNAVKNRINFHLGV